MANDYQLAGQSQTVRVLSQTQTVPVQAVGLFTKPSGVYMVVPVPLSEWKAGNQGPYLDAPSQLVEQVIAGGLVNAVTYVQSTDASGLLSSFLDFTVSYVAPNGPGFPSSTKVRLPFTAFESFDAFTQPLPGGTVSDQIRTAYNTLVTSSGGPPADKI